MSAWILPRCAAAAVGCVVLTSACGLLDDVCPAIGYTSTLVVELDDPADTVADLALCDDGVCTTIDSDDPPARIDGPMVEAEESPDGAWRLTLPSAPETLTVQAIDSAADVVGEWTVEPKWKRVGGTERCGGPMEATVSARL